MIEFQACVIVVRLMAFSFCACSNHGVVSFSATLCLLNIRKHPRPVHVQLRPSILSKAVNESFQKSISVPGTAQLNVQHAAWQHVQEIYYQVLYHVGHGQPTLLAQKPKRRLDSSKRTGAFSTHFCQVAPEGPPWRHPRYSLPHGFSERKSLQMGKKSSIYRHLLGRRNEGALHTGFAHALHTGSPRKPTPNSFEVSRGSKRPRETFDKPL